MMEEAILPDSYLCQLCGNKLKTKRILNKHIKRTHGLCWKEVAMNPSSGKINCNEENCYYSFKRVEDLRNHLRVVHNFSFHQEKLSFECTEDFFSWKKDFENKNKVSYIKAQGCKKNETHAVQYYWCNRSGNSVKNTTSGKRKNRESCKMGTHCTATLTATTSLADDSVTVDLCDTHYGHEMRLKFLRIPEDIRNDIASDLSRGVEVSDILKNIRSTMVTSDLERKHLITHKDIRNIKKAFRLGTVAPHKDNSTNLATLDELKAKGDEESPIRCRYQWENDDSYVVIVHNDDGCANEIVVPTVNTACVDAADDLHSVGDERITSTSSITKKRKKTRKRNTSLKTKLQHVLCKFQKNDDAKEIVVPPVNSATVDDACLVSTTITKNQRKETCRSLLAKLDQVPAKFHRKNDDSCAKEITQKQKNEMSSSLSAKLDHVPAKFEGENDGLPKEIDVPSLNIARVDKSVASTSSITKQKIEEMSSSLSTKLVHGKNDDGFAKEIVVPSVKSSIVDVPDIIYTVGDESIALTSITKQIKEMSSSLSAKLDLVMCKLQGENDGFAKEIIVMSANSPRLCDESVASSSSIAKKQKKEASSSRSAKRDHVPCKIQEGNDGLAGEIEVSSVNTAKVGDVSPCIMWTSSITKKTFKEMSTSCATKQEDVLCKFQVGNDGFANEIEVSSVNSASVDVPDTLHTVGDERSILTSITKKQIKEMSSSLSEKLDHITDEIALIQVKQLMSQTLGVVEKADPGTTLHSQCTQAANKNVSQNLSNSPPKKKQKLSFLPHKPNEEQKELLLKLDLLATSTVLNDHNYL